MATNENGNKSYYVTFPAKDTARQDMYVCIRAPSEDAARRAAHSRFPKQWAFIYNHEQFKGQAERFGLRCLETFAVSIE